MPSLAAQLAKAILAGDEFHAMVISVMLEDQCSECANSIQVNITDILTCDHCVQSEFATGVVHHEVQCICACFWYSVDHIPGNSSVPNDGENLPA